MGPTVEAGGGGGAAAAEGGGGAAAAGASALGASAAFGAPAEDTSKLVGCRSLHVTTTRLDVRFKVKFKWCACDVWVVACHMPEIVWCEQGFSKPISK